MLMTPRNVLAASIMALGSSVMAPAWAADSGDAADPGQANTLEEVVVTGTLIRGAEVTGKLPLTMDTEAIISSGAVTTNEILAQVPQVGNYFNSRAEQDPRGAQQTIINRPNLRNLPGFNSASGATTLVLVDGHRITPMGLDQASLDPDVIPASVIERVDIVTDGGSSLYGADAVGGVINFITKKKFDGVQIDLDYGADEDGDYDTSDIAVTGGTGWDSGSVMVSLSHNQRDNLKNADRDWATRGTWTEDGVQVDGTECIEPAGAITTYYNYAGTTTSWTDNPLAPGAGVFPVGEACDIKGQESLVPEQERDNLWVSVNQEVTESINFNMASYYTKRKNTYSRYPLGDTISGQSPAELMVPGNPGDLYDVPSLGFSYGANPAYKNRDMTIDFDTWGFSPEFTVALPKEWQLRQTFHYGHSETKLIDPQDNREKMLAYYDNGNGPLDPSNIAALDAGILNDILDFEYAGETTQDLFLSRTVVDGELFELPAGTVRMAAGVEFAYDNAKRRQGNAPRGGLSDLSQNDYNRDTNSVFAEVQVPILQSLDLSLSIRRDDYSDFGDTTNPSAGIKFTPFEWISVFGHWGEAFNAPTAVDGLASATIRNYNINAISSVPDPNNEIDPERTDVLQIVGSTPGTLKPQTAETWGAGFKIEPTFAPGLQLSSGYYKIDFTDILGAADPTSEAGVLAAPDKFIWNPTQAELDSFLSVVDNADQYPDINVQDVGLILDRRSSNTDKARIDGIDFSVSYAHDTSLGSMFYGIAGTKTLNFETSNGTGWVDNLEYDTPDLNFAGTVGWSRDNIRAKLTVKYSSDFKTASAQLDQTKVKEFVVTDLFAAYDFEGGSAITEGLSLRFNVDNLFDEDPPVWRRNGFALPYSGFTIGRVFKVGLTKTF